MEPVYAHHDAFVPVDGILKHAYACSHCHQLELVASRAQHVQETHALIKNSPGLSNF